MKVTPALCDDMEGILWKWTNYFTGWQPRWFVLETGILSYYKSQDDVNNGCKGSIKMSVCDVIVHPTDNTRLDLIIPGEAHFYVKSATPQERQHWLVALGSCKACLRSGRKDSKPDEISEDGIRAKKSELRLYCDLLMQQVHSVKSAIQEETTPDVDKLNEATSLLSATCDTFIATLEDCLRLTNASAPYPNPPASPLVTDAALPASPSRRPNQLKPSTSRGSGIQIQRSTSSDRNSLSPNSPKSIVDGPGADIAGARGYPGSSKSMRARNSASRSRTPSESSELSAAEKDRLSQNGRSHSPGLSRTKGSLREETEREDRDAATGDDGEGQNKIETIFSTMPASFMDVRLDEDGGVPVLPFLNACQSVLLIFDKLNPTAFMPIKLDISGNIKKIKQKYTTDPEGYRTLQAIVQFEVRHQQATMSQSATVALLWLKRAMQFIREFLAEVQTGKSELEECAQTAYTRTLRSYHSLVIRGVFTLAVKSVPYRKDFLLQLANSASDSENPEYPQVIRKDIEDYITAQDVLVKILDDFYESQGLDYKEMM